jgi:hypothetical protein
MAGDAQTVNAEVVGHRIQANGIDPRERTAPFVSCERAGPAVLMGRPAVERTSIVLCSRILLRRRRTHGSPDVRVAVAESIANAEGVKDALEGRQPRW